MVADLYHRAMCCEWFERPLKINGNKATKFYSANNRRLSK